MYTCSPGASEGSLSQQDLPPAGRIGQARDNHTILAGNKIRIGAVDLLMPKIIDARWRH